MGTPEDPKVYHYFVRDRRRSVMPPLVTENAHCRRVAALPAQPPDAPGAAPPLVAVDGTPLVRPPRASASESPRLRQAREQPPSSGYFPIINCQ